MRRHITDDEIKEAHVPDDTLLIVTENGQQREVTFAALMVEKGDQFNSTDFMLLSTALVHFGSYTDGSYGWSAKVKNFKG